MNMMKWKVGIALVLILAILNTASAVQIEEVGKTIPLPVVAVLLQ